MTTTDAYRHQALEAAAHKAGLKDAALLQIASADLTPHAAVADLRKRFPAAFRKRYDADLVDIWLKA